MYVTVCGPSFFWDLGFVSRRGYGYLSLVSVVCVGLCDRLISRPEDFYRLCVSECDVETSAMRRPRLS